MTDREKLIELLCKVQYQGNAVHGSPDTYIQNSEIADHLIANGVTLDNQVSSSKWIPVTERLPEPWKWILCYCEAGNIEMLRYDDFMEEWGSININRAYKKEYVTHWMPLPEPPKED